MLSCQGELIVVPDNIAPDYSGVSTLKVQNYVNRVSIDLLGREPVDVEMDAWVAALRSGELQRPAREEFVRLLMENTDSVAGDGSYNQAYFSRLYDQMMVRFLEGASDGFIRSRRALFEFAAEKDSLNGNWAGYQEAQFQIGKLNNILDSRASYRG
ncbi:MAG: hypothetical protein AB8F95_01590, partial [Bacteroidia bacterium]